MVPILAGMTIPDPVFLCSIEPSSISVQKQLDAALNNLQKEDPSLRVCQNCVCMYVFFMIEKKKNIFFLNAPLSKLKLDLVY